MIIFEGCKSFLIFTSPFFDYPLTHLLLRDNIKKRKGDEFYDLCTLCNAWRSDVA